MNQEELIEKVVTSFYEKATTDFLIGHQFRKIQEFKSGDPLAPPIEAFAHHIPRIVVFWKIQMLNLPLPSTQSSFNLPEAHAYLKIRRGELDRWVLLFNETLDSFEKSHSENSSYLDLINQWREKLDFFRKVFFRSPVIFPKKN